MSAMTVAPKPVTPVSPSRDTLSVTDNRTGMSYEIPIHEGAIRATELRKIKSGADDFGVVSYDPGFMNTAACRIAITYIGAGNPP